MSRRISGGQQNIAELVNSIPALTRGDLITRWQHHYGSLPHKLVSTRLLAMAVAYAVQVEHFGGLPKRTRKELAHLGKATGAPVGVSLLDGSPGPLPRKQRQRLHSHPRGGTRFVREWNGKSHVVEVVEKGFMWQGQTYRSLSAIAGVITGARWSGPRFFGVVS